MFTALLADLIKKAISLGFDVALDEVAQHQLKGHMEGSLHYFGCAADLLLYNRGEYLTETKDYKEIGEYWKTLHPYCRWGGDFMRSDGGHFSFSPPELFGKRA